MRKYKIISIFMIIFILLNMGVAFGAYDDDYEVGYRAGLSIGHENYGKEPPIYVYTAWNRYVNSGALNNYKGNIYDFQDGFYDGYEEGLTGIGVKVNYADILGKTLGGIYGARDFQNGRKSDWAKALPTDKSLISMFDLNAETSAYRESFFTEFKKAFEEGYLVSFEKAHLDPYRITMQTGVKDGEEIGKILGNIYGAKDYYEMKSNDFLRHLPSDRAIMLEYSLRNDSQEYEAGFVSGFKRAYETEYNKAYREANKNDTLRDEKDAYANGKAVGVVRGEIRATLDYMEKKTNLWRRSMPYESEVIYEFGLIYQSYNYRTGFTSGFYDGYSEGYNSAYKKLSQEFALGKAVSGIVPISGGSMSSNDKILSITVDKGIFYNPINITIDNMSSNDFYLENKYIKASDVFRVSILNPSANLDNSKSIELKFEFYGDKNKSGIYKFVNNKWAYIPSVADGNFIKANVKPNSITSNGSLYAVLIDKNAPTFSDARGHWAKDEINTYVRRGIIYGYNDNTFKPERSISRAEFLTLLSRVYSWNLPTYTSNTTHFKDYSTFGNRNSIISYALSSGYIKGYDDGTFKPNNPISYKEVEIIMARALKDSSFKWYNTSAKMLYEKNVRSKSYDNVNNNITRAEVVYMLYILNEWRY